MADDFDVEAMLEAPYRQDGDVNGKSEYKDRSKSKKKRSRSRDRDRERDRRRDRDRDRDDDRRRHRSRSRERRRRSRSRDRRRSRDKSRSPKRRSHSRERKRSHSKERKNGERERSPELTPEERDARTVFCMQLAARLRPRDLEEFFSSVGKVKDVRIIVDNKTRRSKGIAYVEFREVDSVPLAMGLSGQRLLGVPIIIQPSQAEKNRQTSMMAAATQPAAFSTLTGGKSGPMRLYVGSLHFNITEEMLRGIFEPFGRILDITLIKDSDTGQSKGFGFLTFGNADDAKKALEQLNGFELAGRPMKVGNVTERQGGETTFFDHDEVDRAGFDLGATGRLQLMAKLAEGTGFSIPKAAASALGTTASAVPVANTATIAQANMAATSTPPIATQCFMLSNLFDPTSETSSAWETEVRDDVIEECNKNGGVVHIYVDKASPQGNVYVKCPSIASAVAAVNSLHGRFFAGRVITAAYVPLPNYHQLFPDAARSLQLLLASNKSYPTPAL